MARRARKTGLTDVGECKARATPICTSGKGRTGAVLHHQFVVWKNAVPQVRITRIASLFSGLTPRVQCEESIGAAAVGQFGVSKGCRFCHLKDYQKDYDIETTPARSCYLPANRASFDRGLGGTFNRNILNL